MQLSCPNCGVRYAVSGENWPREEDADGALLLRPRKVRCKVCQEVWAAVPQEDEPPLALEDPLPPLRARSDAESAPETEDGTEDDGEARPRRLWPRLLIGLLVVVALVVGGWAALSSRRIDLSAYGLPAIDVPPFPAGVDFSSIGLPQWELPRLSLPQFDVPRLSLPTIPPPPLELKASAARKALPHGGTVWEISGTLHNPTSETQPMPPLEISILDTTGHVVSRSMLPARQAEIAPGETARFETSSLDPPAPTSGVRVEMKPASLSRR